MTTKTDGILRKYVTRNIAMLIAVITLSIFMMSTVAFSETQVFNGRISVMRSNGDLELAAIKGIDPKTGMSGFVIEHAETNSIIKPGLDSSGMHIEVIVNNVRKDPSYPRWLFGDFVAYTGKIGLALKQEKEKKEQAAKVAAEKDRLQEIARKKEEERRKIEAQLEEKRRIREAEMEAERRKKEELQRAVAEQQKALEAEKQKQKREAEQRAETKRLNQIALEKAVLQQKKALEDEKRKQEAEILLDSQPPQTIVGTIQQYDESMRTLTVLFEDFVYMVKNAPPVDLIEEQKIRLTVKRVQPKSNTIFLCTFVSYDQEFITKEKAKAAEQKMLKELERKHLAKLAEQKRKEEAARKKKEQEIAQKKRQAEIADYKKRQADLKSGKIAIESFEDAMFAFDPITDNRLIMEVAMGAIDGPKPTGEYHHLVAHKVVKEKGIYIWWDAKSRTGFAFTNIKKQWGEIYAERFVKVIGKHVSNIGVTLFSGQEVKIPVLVDCYITTKIR